jgi:hypothetical protein
VVCGEEVDEKTSSVCNVCGGRFHLNQRNDQPGKDCGAVWINEQYLALEFACQRCLDEAGSPSPATRILRPRVGRRRYRRRACTMAQEQPRPRRRRRRRRGRQQLAGEPSAPVETPETEAHRRRQPAPWQWRTFPVFCAFVVGAFLILLIAPEPNTGLYSVLFFGFLGAAAFSAAHIVSRLLVTRRRRG